MSDHVTVNRDYWDGMAEDWVAAGERAWASDTVTWGNWQIPEAELRLFPDDMTDMDAIELGCGTGYVSAWMARRGARVTGIDVSTRQLATAERLRGAHGLDITFLEGDAEATGLSDGAFDFAISEYGAAIWCDPDRWLPEAHRLLGPGGTLVFLGNHPMTLITTPANGAPCEKVLQRPYRDLTGADWRTVEIDPGGIEFNRTISGWMALFDTVGFDVLRYQELFAPLEAMGARYSIPSDWAKAYPAEQVWSLRRRG